MDVMKTDGWKTDIVSVKATYGLAGSLMVGLVMWGTALFLLI